MYERHLYIVGKTGTGKSTFLQNLILKNKGGFAVLDPHGDLAEAVADSTDCIYFEPTEIPITFNVLENVPAHQRHLVAAQVVASFKAIWADSWGPRLEWILYNSLRLLLDNSLSIDNSQTLLDISKLLTDPHYRQRCLKRASYKQFWENEFDQWDPRYRNEAIAPVLNKVGQLAADPVLVRTLGRRSTLHLEKIMNTSQRLVVNLSKGKLGETPSHLLGALLVSAFAQAAERRASIPPQQRVPFTLFVDEFQNFATDSFADILSESRKYKLSLVLAHQFLGQVPDYLRQAVFGNVGTIISFRVGAEDAPLIAKEMDIRNSELLTDLANFEAYSRTAPYNHFSLKVPLPPPPLQRLEAVKRRTRARYCRAQ